jgi:hypothetical protein
MTFFFVITAMNMINFDYSPDDISYAFSILSVKLQPDVREIFVKNSASNLGIKMVQAWKAINFPFRLQSKIVTDDSYVPVIDRAVYPLALENYSLRLLIIPPAFGVAADACFPE